MSQLDLFGPPGSATDTSDGPWPVTSAQSTPAPPRPPTARELMAALRRDLDTLAGPPQYIAGGDRAFYEERIAYYRQALTGRGDEV